MTPEVAIIGASAAGLFAAYLLARRGLHVRVFEQADRLGLTPRTLIVTSRMQDLLGVVGERAIVNEIRRFELVADGRVASIHLRRPDLVIERSALIAELAGQAEAAGVRVVLGRRFRSLEPNGAGLSLVFEDRGVDAEQVAARTVVGADGGFSMVARVAGWPRLPTVPLAQAVVRRPADLPQDLTRVWFVPQDTPYFYWLVPESPTRAVLGLIGEDGRETRRCLERFLEKLGLTPIQFQGARIPLYRGWVPAHRAVGDGHVYLVGDAGGQVKVTTVGGIVTGFRGAIGVAEAILNGGTSRELRALRRELDFHLLVRRVLSRLTQADYGRVFELLGGSGWRVLSAYTRDEANRLLWHLCLTEPRLLLLGLRGLLGEVLGVFGGRGGTAGADRRLTRGGEESGLQRARAHGNIRLTDD